MVVAAEVKHPESSEPRDFLREDCLNPEVRRRMLRCGPQRIGRLEGHSLELGALQVGNWLTSDHVQGVLGFRAV